MPYALRDAKVAFETFRLTMGIPAERLHHVEGASRDEIVDAVRSAAEQVGPGGRLWVSYAGHGAASPSTGELMLVGDDATHEVSDSDPAVARDLAWLTELRRNHPGFFW